MKPLSRENTIWEFLRKHIFMISGTCFTVSSRINILSTFYQILLILGLHFGTLGPTFRGLFFRPGTTPKICFFLLLGRGHLGPHREKGGTGRHLGGKGPEEAQRRLGLKKLIDVCSQMQKFLLFFNFTKRF